MAPSSFLGARAALGSALLLAIGAGMSGTARSQDTEFIEVTDTHLPADFAGPCMDAAAADVDGDGDLDLALAMEFLPNVLLVNDGTGRFTDSSGRLPKTTHDSEDVAFADFDGDGDLDVVLVSEDDRTDELYLNDGTGTFSDASARLPTNDVSNALAVLDLDGDGTPDVLTGNIGINRVLLGDGRGGFRDETDARWPQRGASSTQDLELADVDGDGDLDVVVGNEGQNQLFLNEGGHLTDATAGRLPPRDDETREIRAADVDADGDLDLLVANVRFGMQASAQDDLLVNDGSGRFTTAPGTQFPEDARSNFTIQAIDLDGDGDLDALAPSTVFPDVESEFLVVYVAGQQAAVAHGRSLETRDADGDGDIDLLLSSANGTRTFSAESGRFVAEREPSDTGLEAVDLDDDGAPDAAIADLALEISAATALRIADVDGDGDIDVVMPRRSSMDAVGNLLTLMNDGRGNFTRVVTEAVLGSAAEGNGFDIEIADFDGDGLTDLFFCNRASLREPESAAGSGGTQRLFLRRSAP